VKKSHFLQETLCQLLSHSAYLITSEMFVILAWTLKRNYSTNWISREYPLGYRPKRFFICIFHQNTSIFNFWGGNNSSTT